MQLKFGTVTLSSEQIFDPLAPRRLVIMTSLLSAMYLSRPIPLLAFGLKQKTCFSREFHTLEQFCVSEKGATSNQQQQQPFNQPTNRKIRL